MSGPLFDQIVAALSKCTCKSGRNQHGFWRLVHESCPACGLAESKARAVGELLAPALKEARAEAWDEGVQAAQREAKREMVCERPSPLTNPYRGADR